MEKEILIAIRKTDKYAVTTGGDTVDFIERPKGGVSLVLADAQGSGKSAKLNSMSVVSNIVQLINDGVRDGAAARAAHDKLFAAKGGKVSATLVIVSVDLHTKSLVVSRNGNSPVIVWCDGEYDVYDEDIVPLGFHYEVKPKIYERPICDDLWVFGCSDGVRFAGRQSKEPITVEEVAELINTGIKAGQGISEIADALIDLTVARDKDRPRDDMSIFLMHVKNYNHKVPIRKMDINFPYTH